MKILVTGSSGFIGRAFCNYAKNHGNTVLKYDLPDCDILNTNQLKKSVADADVCVHFAAIADLYETAKDIKKNFNVNVKGSFGLGILCAEHDTILINISTCCVYGNTEMSPETENLTIPKTIEPYACSKMAAEYLLRGIINLNHVNLRIGTVYGENMRESLFNYVALKKIVNGDIIEVNGDGRQTRNYIYIGDLVRGVYSATTFFYDYPFYSGEAVNICGTEETSVNDTIKIAEAVTGKRAKIKRGTRRYGEINHENISIKKARDLFGWFPLVSYREGMEMTYKNDWRLNGSRPC